MAEEIQEEPKGPAFPGEGEPFMPRVDPRQLAHLHAIPTEAQQAWMRAHPQYKRLSHSVLGLHAARGTLNFDGSFVPEDKAPVSDGNGNFGVGIPIR
jgi:hypothetical protein